MVSITGDSEGPCSGASELTVPGRDLTCDFVQLLVFQVICRVVQIVDSKFRQYLVNFFNSCIFISMTILLSQPPGR